MNGKGEYYAPTFRSHDSDGRYIRREGYVTDVITDFSIDFLEQRDSSRPFCLLIHHKAPHRNWMPDVKCLELYEDMEIPMPETFYDDYTTRGYAAHTQRMTVARELNFPVDLKVSRNDKERDNLISRLTPEQKRVWQAFYDQKNQPVLNGELNPDELVRWKYQRYQKDYLRCIKSVDDGVGRLLDYLEKEGLMENTIVVYTSDQGFYMGEHGWFDKRFMYEESFRTPLVIAWNGVFAPGTVCEELVQNIDFAPTYLDVAGLGKLREMSGASFLPLASGKAPSDWRDYLYYHYYDYYGEHNVRKHDGVADKRYKLIHFYGEGILGDEDVNYNELYDLKLDPNELNNVYGNPKYRHEARRLEKRLDRFRKELSVTEF